MTVEASFGKEKNTVKRRITLLVIFAVLACAGFILSVMKGSVEVPAGEIWQAVLGTLSGMHEQIVHMPVHDIIRVSQSLHIGIQPGRIIDCLRIGQADRGRDRQLAGRHLLLPR